MLEEAYRCTSEGEVEEANLKAEGRALIESVAKEAGLDRPYEKRVLLAGEDVRETLLDAVREYDTICVGATRSTPVAQALFGSIPEQIGEQSEGTVAIARGPQYRPRSVAQGLVDWLSS